MFGPRDSFFVTTPGAANDNTAAPLPVFINEWMAANTSFVGDPADGDFDDWFELYNPNDVAVDLTGYALSDVLTAGGPRWSIPAGTTISPRGFLLVWADNETGQNATNRADLHANFQLRQAGEAIGLFAPNGSVADSVTFGNQTNNISEGRWRDGAQDIYFMPTPDSARGECCSFHAPRRHRNPQCWLQWQWRFRDYLERRAGDFLPDPIQGQPQRCGMAGSLECRGGQFDCVSDRPVADVARAALLPHPAPLSVGRFRRDPGS